MPSPTLAARVFENEDELGSTLARRIIDGVGTAAREERAFLLGCPGGRSLRSTYRKLKELAVRQSVDLSPLVVVMMDDYVTSDGRRFAHVPIEAHYSCRRFANDEIAAPLAGLGGAPGQDRVWLPDPADPSAYDRRIARAGGIDLFLLASGASDGHIAFNPPGSSRDSTTRIVELPLETRTDNLATFPDFRSVDEVPTHGVTVGIGTIAEQSRSAVMVCLGSQKRRTVRRIAAARRFEVSWPATIAVEIPGCELWVDRPAAG